MPPTTFEDDDVDYEDETPFLKHDDDDVPRRKTSSLPMMQIAVLLSAWVAESVMDHSISPYLNEVRVRMAAAAAAAAARRVVSRQFVIACFVCLCAEHDYFSLSEASRLWAEMCGRSGTTRAS